MPAGSDRSAGANATRCGECVWITALACGLARYTSACMATTSVLIPSRSPSATLPRGGPRRGHRARNLVSGVQQAHRDIHHGAVEREV
jgi:hypothetical protein